MTTACLIALLALIVFALLISALGRLLEREARGQGSGVRGQKKGKGKEAMTETEVGRWLELRAMMRNGGWTAAERQEYAALDRQLAALELQAAEQRLEARLAAGEGGAVARALVSDEWLVPGDEWSGEEGGPC